MVAEKKQFLKIILLSWGLSPLWLLVWNAIERLYGGDGIAAAFLTVLTIPCFGIFGSIIGFAACKNRGGCESIRKELVSRFTVLTLWILAAGWLFFHCGYR